MTPSVTVASPTEELSLWLRYNRLLIYVVVGGGCGVGLILVFVIMLCILAGCVARRRRYRVRRKHRLETSTRHHRSRMQGTISIAVYAIIIIQTGRPNAQTRRHLSHSITNLPEIEIESELFINSIP